MGSKFFNYGDTGEIVELTIRDFSGAKLDTYKWKAKDNKESQRVSRTVYNKYGIRFYPERIETDRDLDWLKDKKQF